jgi:methionine-rich copper-binding protein CopC
MNSLAWAGMVTKPVCGLLVPPRVRAWVPVVLSLLAAALVGVGLAYAHADYARSEPGAGAVVAAAPARVDVWFTQDMFRRQGANWLRVTGPDGADVTAGDAVIDDDDRRHLWVDLLPNLPPGEYTVAWHTLSAEDGDEDDGVFTFLVDPAAQATSTPMLLPTAAPSPTPLTGPVTAPPAPTPTPTPAPSGGCGQGLLPIAGLLLAGRGLRRRRRP